MSYGLGWPGRFGLPKFLWLGHIWLPSLRQSTEAFKNNLFVYSKVLVLLAFLQNWCTAGHLGPHAINVLSILPTILHYRHYTCYTFQWYYLQSATHDNSNYTCKEETSLKLISLVTFIVHQEKKCASVFPWMVTFAK